MCCQDSSLHLSAEEEIAAEESLSIYCKPVELYNILQRRAIKNVTYFISKNSHFYLLHIIHMLVICIWSGNFFTKCCTGSRHYPLYICWKKATIGCNDDT